jgi:hypothetical protein
MLDILGIHPAKYPSIFIDLEGVELGHIGEKTCLMTVYHNLTQHVFVVDIHLLQATAFTTPSAQGTNRKDLLELSEISKDTFDTRNGALLPCRHSPSPAISLHNSRRE